MSTRPAGHPIFGKRVPWRSLGCVAALLYSAGCGDNELGIEHRHPNTPPETVLSSGPPDSVTATSYRVEFHWSGTDIDGRIDHYDYIMIDHPPPQSHLDGSSGDGDPTRVAVEVPHPDDPRWIGTTTTDSTFVTLADTLRRSPLPGPGEDDEDIRQAVFARWHTFFVRAVDSEGLADPTPDYRTFNANNVAPFVRLRAPVKPAQEFHGPPVITFRWGGSDPVDEITNIPPVASRWVLIPSRLDLSRPGTSYTGFPDSLYDLPDACQWSEWRRWDDPDSLGVSAVVSGMARVGDAPGVGYYIFAVQALDEAGAVSPVFDWRTVSKNNTVLIRVSGGIGPLLRVRDDYLGTQVFIGGSRPVRIDIAADQPLRFQWSADTEQYGGTVTGYRYGWDLREPSNPAEWSSWTESNVAAPMRTFGDGTHRFYVQVKDNAESITQAIYELVVHRVTRARPVLWVDDSDYLTDVQSETAEDTRWIQVLTDIAEDHRFAFDPIADIFDVAANRREPPPISTLFGYESVIWSVRSNQRGLSALRAAAQFVDPIPSRNQNTAKSYNYMNVYLANGGNLWINGFRPARQLWPNEREKGHEVDAVNVTNWDDPIEPHPPGIDSVGTTSLLYAMGIEMFDVGSATDSRRKARDQFCFGLAATSEAAGEGPPMLLTGPLWPQAGGTARTNIEIYNMPGAMVTQRIPLIPVLGISMPLYAYVSGLPVDPERGFNYPDTADRQPVLVLAKGWPAQDHFSRAFCGFEPHLLTLESHTELAWHILVHHFGLGTKSP